MVKPWGCPADPSHQGPHLVRDTGADGEGYRVRLRQCQQCGTLWATEEVPIAVEAFYSRNARRRAAERAAQARRRGRRQCKWCHHTYQAGQYRQHCARAYHVAALVPISRDRTRRRRYSREWMRQRRDSAA